MKKKKKYKPQRTATDKPVIQATKPSPGKPYSGKPASSKSHYKAIFFILLITLVAYLPAVKAEFVNWDDPDYTNKQTLAGFLSDYSLLFTKSIQGNFHPLTMFSLTLNYSLSGMDPWSYHLFNLLFHLANCLLVYRLALLLSNKNSIIAFTSAILFAIHPMHVESVAWVSERKDVLYGLFFILGLISYTKYVTTGSRKQYWYTALFLVLSLLSKPAAVIFPVALFCIDLLKKRKLSLRLFIEKIPFFLLVIPIGILTVLSQQKAGATGTGAFSMGERILFVCYNFMMYIVKSIVPLNLSAFHPFPPTNKSLPVEYYLSPLFVITMAILFFYSLKRNRIVAFGLLFFLVNSLLIMQFFLVGSAIYADRYTYIPYIGLFFIAGWLIDRYANTKLSRAYAIIIPVTLVLSILTFRQAGIWQTSAKLWDNAIKVQPSSKAYDNRAVLFRDEKNYQKAIEYYTKAIHINVIDHEGYTNRGNVYFDLKQYDSAFQDFQKALSIKPDYYTAMDNLGALYGLRGQFDSAIIYLTRALSIKPDYAPAYRNRGLAYAQSGRNEEAIKDFEESLKTQPDDPDIINFIGACYLALKKYDQALSNINKAIELKPDPHFYLNRAYCYNAMQKTDAARSDALTAKQGGLEIDPGFAKLLGIQ